MESYLPRYFFLSAAAAFNGHLECLQYARENGCPWDLINEDNDDDTVEHACSNAAFNGHLECLKYAHENGFNK